ncbi:MAG: CDP-glycerol glycerophosphotransferase family protein [Lachnospiraceae bacterium]|nr:CDP-glycerol glycerophosphotransferase family protein [Lachnospiraceae bacterium]
MEVINSIKEGLVQASIINVRWERVTVSFDVQLKYANEAIRKLPKYYYAVNGKYRAKAQFKVLELENDCVRLSMNITNPGDCECIKMGTYSIYVCDEERALAYCVIDPSIVPFIEDYSRSFLHNKRKKSFIVNFSVAEDEEDLRFIMYVMDATKTPVELLTNRELLKSAIKDPIVLIKKNMGRVRWKFLYHHYVKKYKKKKKTVLFMTEQSPTLGSNLQAVMDKMKERGLDSEYTILSSARPASYVKQTKKSTKQLIKKIAMSRVIFIDDHVPMFDWLELNERTKLNQLWHAGAGFKSSGYSRWGHLGCPAPVSCHRQYRYGIAGSKHIGKFFAEVFGVNNEQILPTGMPRMDEYLDPTYRENKTKELYEKYPMCKGKKVILFAPTYRGRGRAGAYYPYEMIDFNRLYEFCGDEYVVLFKMHPWVAFPVPIDEDKKDRFVDVNTFPNINDLFYITDLLITDYSSNIFEFSLMRKPMLFFAFDKIQYAFSRGFHRDYEEAAPGKVCYDFEQVMDALENQDFEFEKVEEYVDKHFDYIDSHAADRVIDWILLGQIPEDIKEQLKSNKVALRRMKSLKFDSLADGEEE